MNVLGVEIKVAEVNEERLFKKEENIFEELREKSSNLLRLEKEMYSFVHTIWDTRSAKKKAGSIRWSQKKD